ncbi:hypothetical protein CJ738_36670, partial [Klebsiella pneumoniae]
YRARVVDIATVRDTADNTFYLFNRIAPTLGQAGRIFYRARVVDIATVRDTADNTFYLFNRIAPTLGQAG